ncbi:OmpA family protein [Piscinibacter sp.]|uniref:OmpA family protein n=1 Tax=Piscinibacter sp. TaxID=1903157 RepID=UPI002BE4305E|nr:OmpA family protein [Albitalea sp.]HUG23956.1 OmpA family protein [Albitalea sp.]
MTAIDAVPPPPEAVPKPPIPDVPVPPAPAPVPASEVQQPARVLFFEPDAYKLAPRYRPTLEAHARKLKASPALRLVIEAYTDNRGAADYNLALSKKRAETVAKQLVAMGVARHRIELVHHGERGATKGARNDVATAGDRRVELRYR